MIEGLAQFNAEFASFTQELLPREVATVQRTTALKALRLIVKHTPVDDGPTRSAWQVEIGEGSDNDVDFNDGVSATVERGAAAIADLKPYSVVAIFNNKPHILVLEEGGFIPADPGPSKDKRKGRKGEILVRGGYSVQAPHGMVGVTLEEIRGELGD